MELCLFHPHGLPSCIRLAYHVPRYKKHHDCKGSELDLSTTDESQEFDSGSAWVTASIATLTHVCRDMLLRRF